LINEAQDLENQAEELRSKALRAEKKGDEYAALENEAMEKQTLADAPKDMSSDKQESIRRDDDYQLYFGKLEPLRGAYTEYQDAIDVRGSLRNDRRKAQARYDEAKREYDNAPDEEKESYQESLDRFKAQLDDVEAQLADAESDLDEKI